MHIYILSFKGMQSVDYGLIAVTIFYYKVPTTIVEFKESWLANIFSKLTLFHAKCSLSR
jgi:hypothetical protein